MRRETFDDSYAVSLILDEFEQAFALAEEAGFSEAVASAHDSCENDSLLRRAGRLLAAATLELF